MAAEFTFYRLTVRPLEAALPELLEKALERGLRAVVRARSRERVEDLNTRLWTWREESFLPHGSASDGRPERQPVWLTAGDELPNAPRALFLVDGADWAEAEAGRLDRIVVMFDGNDPEALDAARAQWRRAASAGGRAVFWAQTSEGGWVKEAERG